MLYNVAQLLKEPIGSTREYQLQETFSRPQRITDRVHGLVHLMRTHQGVLVTAELDIAVTLTCSRCLDPFTRLSAIAIEEEFFPTVDINTGRSIPLPEDAEGALLIDSRHTLDLSEVLRQYVITDEPMKPLCQEDCHGLCQICGVNQNQGYCDCRSREANSPWGKLAAMLNPQDS
jgi:uncharacterized protein